MPFLKQRKHCGFSLLHLILDAEQLLQLIRNLLLSFEFLLWPREDIGVDGMEAMDHV